MAVPECGSVQVLLDYIACLAPVETRLCLLWLRISVDHARHVGTRGGIGAGVQLGCVTLLLALKELFILPLMLLCVLLYLCLHLIEVI